MKVEGLITPEDWARLKTLNPPLIEKMVNIGEDSARIINMVYKKEELEPKDIKEVMKLRENGRSLKMTVTALKNTDIIEDFKGASEIEEDLERYDKQIGKMERKKGIRALSSSPNYMYTIVEKIGSIIRVLYYVIEAAKKKFLKRIDMKPEQVEEIRKIYRRLLRNMRILSNYYVALEPSENNAKKLAHFYRKVKRSIGVYPLREVLPLNRIEGKNVEEDSSLTINNIIKVTTGNYYSIDNRALSIYIRKGNNLLDKMMDFGRENVKRALFGLSYMDVLYYYTLFFVEMKNRSPWTVEMPSKEELIEKARIEAGGGDEG